jgi:hypothetical protein
MILDIMVRHNTDSMSLHFCLKPSVCMSSMTPLQCRVSEIALGSWPGGSAALPLDILEVILDVASFDQRTLAARN